MAHAVALALEAVTARTVLVADAILGAIGAVFAQRADTIPAVQRLAQIRFLNTFTFSDTWSAGVTAGVAWLVAELGAVAE
jgi:hypothetical protein